MNENDKKATKKVDIHVSVALGLVNENPGKIEIKLKN